MRTSLDATDILLTHHRVLMELGSLFKDQDWSSEIVPAEQLASIITHVLRKSVTSRSARLLLLKKFEGDDRPVEQIIQEEDLTLKPLSNEAYVELAQSLLVEKPDMVKDVVEKGQVKKIKWFVGQMMARSPEGSVEPDVAEAVLKKQLGLEDAK